MDIKKIDINRKMEEFKLKKIKLFGSMLVLMAIVGAAAPASAAVVGEDSSSTTITIKNIEEETDPNFNKLTLLEVPSMFNYGTHEMSAGTITANATVTGDAKVLDARYKDGETKEDGTVVSPTVASRDWDLKAQYDQANVEAENTLVSLKLTLGAATNGNATGSQVTLNDSAATPVVAVTNGVTGNYLFSDVNSVMEIKDVNTGTFTGTITFTLDDTL